MAVFLFISALGLATTKPVHAALDTLAFSARLTTTSGNNVADGTYSITFRLYTASTGGTPIWTETQTTTVSRGEFAVYLGSVTPFTGVDFNSSPLYLAFKVGTDPEMTPRYELGSVPSALNATNLNGRSAAAYFQKDQNETVSGNTTFSGTTGFTGDSTFTGGVAIQPAALSGDALTVHSASGFSGNLLNLKNNNTSEFSVTDSGDTSIRGGLSVGGATTLNNSLTVTTGGANITGDSTVVGNLTVTGAASFGSITGSAQYTNGFTPSSPSAGWAIAAQGPALNTPNAALVSLGNGSFTGSGTDKFIGSSNGTILGINSNASFSGNLVDFQVAGASKFSASSTGAVTTASTLTITSGGLVVSGGGITVTGNSSLTGTLTGLTGLTVASGGASITGDVTVAGNFSATGTVNSATISGGTLSGGSLSSSAVNGLSVAGGTVSAGTWQGTRVAPQYGGTGIDTHLSSGLPTLASGAWSILANGSNNQCLITSGGVPTWGSCSAGGGVTGSGTQNALAYWDTSTTIAAANLLYLDSLNSELGIGTTSPVATLTVHKGTAGVIIAGRNTADTQTTFSVTDAGAVTGTSLNLGSGTVSSGQINGQTISSAANFTGTLTVANGETVTTGGVTVQGGGLTVTGDSSITGALTDLTGLTVASGTVSLPNGAISNAELAHSSLTVSAGTNLSGGGSVALGSSTTLNVIGNPTFAGLITGQAGIAITGGADITGGLNNHAGGITNTGSIAGASTINASSTITGGTLTDGTLSVNSGAITGGTTAVFGTSVTTPNLYGDTAASGNLSLQSTSNALKGNVYFNGTSAYVDGSSNLFGASLNVGSGAVTSGLVNGQTISNAASFTGTVTAATGLTVSAGGAAITGNETLTGNLLASGSRDIGSSGTRFTNGYFGTVDVNTLTVNTSSTVNGQVTITSATSPQLTVKYDGSNYLTTAVASNGAVTFDATGTGAAFTISKSLTANVFNSSGVTLTGGTIDATAIGSTTRSSGKFTTLDANAGLTVSASGAAITGNSSVTGTFGVSSTLTASNGFTLTTGTLSLPNSSVVNAFLANPALTVTAGTNLSGGGSVALGSSTTLNIVDNPTFAGLITGQAGLDITGGFNNHAGGVTNAGSIAGATTINASSTITGGTLTDGTLSVSSGAVTGGTTAVFGTSVRTPTLYGSTGAAGNLTLQSTTNGTLGNVYFNGTTAYVDASSNLFGAGLNVGSGTITSGLVNGQTISSAANFTGSVTVANSLTVSAGGAGITGNLTVTGNVLPSGSRDVGASGNRFTNGYFGSVDVNTLTVDTGSTLNGQVVVVSTSSPQLTVKYDNSNYYTTAVSSAGAVTFDATGAGASFTFADGLTANVFASSGATITGGSIDSTPIGAGGASTGAFTTLSSSSSTNLGTAGNVTLGYASGTVQIISSGLNVSTAGALSGVTSIDASGNITTSGNLATTGSGTITSAGALTVSSGGAAISGNVAITNGSLTTDTSATVNPTTRVANGNLVTASQGPNTLLNLASSGQLTLAPWSGGYAQVSQYDGSSTYTDATTTANSGSNWGLFSSTSSGAITYFGSEYPLTDYSFTWSSGTGGTVVVESCTAVTSGTCSTWSSAGSSAGGPNFTASQTGYTSGTQVLGKAYSGTASLYWFRLRVTGALTSNRVGTIVSNCSDSYCGSSSSYSNSTAVLLQPTGVGAGTYSSHGTFLAINAPTNFTGNLVDFQVSGDGSYFSVSANTGATTAFALSVSTSATVANHLVVSAGGADITGGLNNHTGGITNAGSIAGVTTLNASGTITGGTLTDGTLSVNSGAVTGGTTAVFATSTTTRNVYGSTGAAGNLTLQSTTNGTLGNVYFNGTTAYVDASSNLFGAGLNVGSGTITSGLVNGQTISSAANFTGSVTVANGLTVSTGGASITGDTTLTGNLLASGSRDIGSSGTRFSNGYFGTVDVNTLTVNTSSTVNGSLVVASTTSPQLTVKYDNSNYYTTAVTSAGAVTFDATGTGAAFSFADGVTANVFASSGATITGGSINSTPIGNSSANTGAFTTLSSSSTTNLGTAGNVTLGYASGTVQVISTGLNVSTAGALSGITTIATSSTINGQTISSAANFTGTLTVASGETITSGGLNLSGSGITNAGSIAGATTINASSTITGGTLTDGTASINGGALSGATTISASGKISTTANSSSGSALAATGTASGAGSLLQLGAAITQGSSSGNYLGINSGSGFSGNFIQVENNGNTVFTLTNDSQLQVTKLAPTSTANTWTQVNAGGFTANTGGATGLIAFNDKLYAAGEDDTNGGHVYSTTNGTSWNLVNTAGFGSANNTAIIAPVVYNGALYFGTDNTATGGQVWGTRDGSTWTQSGSSGFGTTNNTRVSALIVFNGALYAGTYNSTNGVQVWRTFDGSTWQQVNTSGFGSANNTRINSWTVYNGSLYVGTQNTVTGGQLWSSTDGVNWTQSGSSGFGASANNVIRGLQGFNSALYAEVNNASGLQVWKSNDGQNGWTQVTTGIASSAHQSTGFIIFNNSLYLDVDDSGGLQVWATSDGSTWTQTSATGFGSSSNTTARSFATYKGYLYTFTSNNTGSQMWRLNTGIITDETGTLVAGGARFGNIQVQNGTIYGIGDLAVNSLSSVSAGVSTLTVSGTPVASGSQALLALGNAALATGSSSGTYIGLNTASSFSGDLVNLQVAGTSEFKVTSSGVVTANGGVTVTSGGLTVTAGGINVNATGITNAGSIAGATTINASSTITGGTLTDGTLSVNSGAVTGGTTAVFGTSVRTPTLYGSTGAAGNLTLQSTTNGTLGNVYFNGTTAYVDASSNLFGASLNVGSGTITSGLVNGQTISSSANFTGTVTAATGLTVSAGGAAITGNLTLTGNLLASGSRDIGSSGTRFTNGYFGTLDVNTLTVNTSSTVNGSLVVSSTTSPQLTVKYDNSNYYTTAVSSAGAVTFDATGAGAAFSFADGVTANVFASSGATITGGSINGTPIGGSTPSTGAFTTLSSSGTTNLGTAGNVTLGYASGTMQVISTGLNVSTAGALSGITTIATSSTINGQTISSAANFTGTLTVATGATISAGGLNLTTSGITNAGSIAGATTINASSTITGGTLTDGTLSVNSGAVTGGTTAVFGTSVRTPTLNGSTGAAGNLTLQSTTNGTLGNVYFNGTTAYVDASSNLFGAGLNVGSGTITSGLVNGQTISSAANFTGSVTVANGLTVSSGGAGITGNLTVTGNVLASGSRDIGSSGTRFTNGYFGTVDVNTLTVNTSTTINGTEVISSTTSPQLTVKYDNSNYYTTAVASNGAVTFDATGAGAAFSFADGVTANVFASSGATITGGSINGTPIGGSTPSTGAFTTLSSSGATNLGTAGNVVIGYSSGTVQVVSTGLNVSTAGALSGITTIATSSTINGQTISSSANLTGTLTVATGLTVTSGGETITAGGLTVTAGGINVNSTGITNAGAVSGVTTLALNNSITQTGTNANTLSGATTFSASGTALSVTNNATIGGTLTVPTIQTASGNLALQATTGTVTLNKASTQNTLQVYESAGVKYASLTDNGTDAILASSSGAVDLQATSGIVNLNTGSTQNYLRVYDSSSTKYTEITHNGTNGVIAASSGELQLKGQGTNQFILGDTGTAVNLVFQESSTITTSGSKSINVGASGDTINLNQSGVTYNVGTLAATGATLNTSSTSTTAFVVNGPTSLSANLLDLQVNGSSKLSVSASGVATVTGVSNSGVYTQSGTSQNTFTGTVKVGSTQSASAWTTSGIALQGQAVTYTDSSTANSGSQTTMVVNSFAQPTLAASGTSVTYTDAANLYIANAPAAGTNVTLTNAWALLVAAGNTKLGGTLTVSSGETITSGGLTVTAGGITITAGGLNVNSTGITNAGSIAGATTIAANNTLTLSGTGANELAVTGAPGASSTASLVQLGSSIASGNASGTFLGMNAAAFFTGDLVNLQTNGVSVASVGAQGLTRISPLLWLAAFQTTTAESTWTDVTGSANGSSNWNLFPNSGNQFDRLYMGVNFGSYSNLSFSKNTGTPGSATITWEVCTAQTGGSAANPCATWSAMTSSGTVDGTTNLSANGVVNWNNTIVKSTVNGVQAYWVRATVATANFGVQPNGLLQIAGLNSSTPAVLIQAPNQAAYTSNANGALLAINAPRNWAGLGLEIGTLSGKTFTVGTGGTTATSKNVSVANDYALGVVGTPGAFTNSTLLRLGNIISNGNNSTNGGTYIGINEPSSGAGSAADFFHFENNGTIEFQGTSAGALTVHGGETIDANGLTVTAGGITITAGGLNVNATGITNAGSIAGATTIAASGLITSTSTTTIIQNTGTPSSTNSFISLASALSSPSSNGTFIGINPSSFTGNFLDFQVNNASKYKVDATGLLTLTGGVTVNAGATTVTGLTVTEAASATANVVQINNNSSVALFVIDVTGKIALGDSLPGVPIVGVDPNSGVTKGDLSGITGATSGPLKPTFSGTTLTINAGAAYAADATSSQNYIQRCENTGQTTISGMTTNGTYYIVVTATGTKTTSGVPCTITANATSLPAFSASKPVLVIGKVVVASNTISSVTDTRFFIGGTRTYVNIPAGVTYEPGMVVIQDTSADNQVKTTTASADTGVAGVIVVGNTTGGSPGQAIMMTTGSAYVQANTGTTRANCALTDTTAGTVINGAAALNSCLGRIMTAASSTAPDALVQIAPY